MKAIVDARGHPGWLSIIVGCFLLPGVGWLVLAVWILIVSFDRRDRVRSQRNFERDYGVAPYGERGFTPAEENAMKAEFWRQQNEARGRGVKPADNRSLRDRLADEIRPREGLR